MAHREIIFPAPVSAFAGMGAFLCEELLGSDRNRTVDGISLRDFFCLREGPPFLAFALLATK